MKLSTLSVIVPVYRNTTLLEYVLDHLVARLPAGAEVIVVDDGSGAETLDVIRCYPAARLVRHSANRGVTAAYNTGARAAVGDVLVFMNSDVLPGEDTLTILQNVVTSQPNAGCVGALLLFPRDFSIQHVGIAFDRWATSHVYKGANAVAFGFAPLEPRQVVTAALMSCSRSLYETIGGFDETYRDGMEDIDFCLRCLDLGRTNYVATRARAMHIESATRGPFIANRRTYNYAIFFSRWKERIVFDLGAYIKRALAAAAVDDVLTLGRRAVNFCNTPNWRDLVTSLDGGISLADMQDASGFVAEHEPIDLYRALPLAFQRSPMPLLFVMDSFRQLEYNAHWFSARRGEDLVVDRHANVARLPLSLLTASSESSQTSPR